MKSIIFIGLDDTDILTSPGTGNVARGMAEFLSGLGFGSATGITRHQLFFDERIPFTSHNSSLCIGFETTKPLSEFEQPCIDYMIQRFQEGSDPGLCLFDSGYLPSEIKLFGQKATAEVLKKKNALELANSYGIFLKELGGTGDGVIGALSAVALRSGGENGRFVQLKGIRDISGFVSVNDLKRKTDIVAVVDEEGYSIADNEIVNSMEWIRPSLVAGYPVLRVRPEPGSGDRHTWITIEQKKGRHLSEEKVS